MCCGQVWFLGEGFAGMWAEYVSQRQEPFQASVPPNSQLLTVGPQRPLKSSQVPSLPISWLGQRQPQELQTQGGVHTGPVWGMVSAGCLRQHTVPRVPALQHCSRRTWILTLYPKPVVAHSALCPTSLVLIPAKVWTPPAPFSKSEFL